MKIKNLSSNLLARGLLYGAGSASKYIESNYRITAQQLIGKNSKGIVLVLIKVLFLHLPGGTEKIQERTSQDMSVFLPAFEPSTFRIQV
jgi:hypothetical protein